MSCPLSKDFSKQKIHNSAPLSQKHTKAGKIDPSRCRHIPSNANLRVLSLRTPCQSILLTFSRTLLGFFRHLCGCGAGLGHLHPGFHLPPDVGGLGRLHRRRGSSSSARGRFVVEVGCVRQVGSFGKRRRSSLWREAAGGARVHESLMRGVGPSVTICVMRSSVGAAPAHRSAVCPFIKAGVAGGGVVWVFGPAPGRISWHLLLLALLGIVIRMRLWGRHGLLEVMFERVGGVERCLSWGRLRDVV